MTDWMKELGVVKADEALDVQVVRAPEKPPRQMQFTQRDNEALQIILLHPVQEGSDDKVYCEITNSKLASEMGMTAGSAAARVARLVKMGVLKAWYSISVETGKVNRRVLEVLRVPPAPWTPGE